MIEVQDITKKIDQTFSLGPISLSIEPGMIYALVGNNGAGKSTLFRMLMDLVKQDNGDIQRLGDATSRTEWKAAFAYVPQTPTMYQGFSLKQLAEFFEISYPNWNQSEYDRLVQLFELPVAKKIDRLSGGMQKKAMLTLALSRGSKFLLLDEPLAGVDIEGQEQMKDELVKYMERSEEQTILFATHVADEVKVLADYVVVMKGGHILGSYEKDQLLSNWKRVWVRGPQERVTGIEHVKRSSQQGSLTECIVEDLVSAEQEFNHQGLIIDTVQHMELREILRIILKSETK